MTVNKVANCDEHPKPKTENLSETLNLGGKFTKLGLTQDYQQLLLDEKLSEYLTIFGENICEEKENLIAVLKVLNAFG